MNKVDRVRINGIIDVKNPGVINIDNPGFIQAEIVKELIPGSIDIKQAILNLNIPSLDTFELIDIDEFIFYFNKFREIWNWNCEFAQLYFKKYGDIKLKDNTNSKTKGNLTPSLIFISFLSIYITYDIKKRVRETWVYMKMIEEADKSRRYSEPVKMVNNLQKYFEFKRSNTCKYMKSFSLFEDTSPDEFRIIQKFRRKYAAYFREFDKKIPKK